MPQDATTTDDHTKGLGSGPPAPAVRLDSVVVAFGGLLAVGGVSLDVEPGTRLAVLGPNGAGKTTLFNTVAGDITPTSGRVWLSGVDATRLPSRTRPKLGVARTYQRTRLFGGLTVEENLVLAQTGKHGPRMRAWHAPGDRRLRERARTAARQVWLAGLEDAVVSELSYGQQRQLEIGMSMVGEPTVLLLDEPASGLSSGERERLVELLSTLDPGITLLLIEHDMDVALKVVDQVVVMAEGVVVATGTPEEISASALVREIYLGRE